MARRTIQLTEEDILVWADYISGRPVKETMEKQGVSYTAIMNRRKKVRDFLGQKFDINIYRLPMFGLVPLVLKSLIHNLKQNNSKVTIATAKGLGLFTGDNEWIEKLAGALENVGSNHFVFNLGTLDESKRRDIDNSLGAIFGRNGDNARSGASDRL